MAHLFSLRTLRHFSADSAGKAFSPLRSLGTAAEDAKNSTNRFGKKKWRPYIN